jgi:hypothetical protein
MNLYIQQHAVRRYPTMDVSSLALIGTNPREDSDRFVPRIVVRLVDLVCRLSSRSMWHRFDSTVQGCLADKKAPPAPFDQPRALGIGLRWGLRRRRFLVSELPLLVWHTSQGKGDPSVFKVGNPSNWPPNFKGKSLVFLSKKMNSTRNWVFHYAMHQSTRCRVPLAEF